MSQRGNARQKTLRVSTSCLELVDISSAYLAVDHSQIQQEIVEVDVRSKDDNYEALGSRKLHVLCPSRLRNLVDTALCNCSFEGPAFLVITASNKKYIKDNEKLYLCCKLDKFCKMRRV